ncbi:MAG: 4-(cytidine 5'-diphospho)-2-C-methyl-D-erythritol kinase [Pseudomonadota bacterium]
MSPAEGTLTGFAPAKVNLTLHLQGRRDDGYHLMSSLVVFPEIGDTLTAHPSAEITLSIGGPFAGNLRQDQNLVLAAARKLSDHHKLQSGAALNLVKSLPVAAGIGGGSTDAATALRVLSRLWDVDVPEGLAVTLGADVPVCRRAPDPQMMEGIGDVVSPAPVLPACAVLLANPGVGVATGEVFGAVREHHPPDGPELSATNFGTFIDFVAWLRRARNDLQAPAIGIAPEIGDVLSALSPAAVARMSGSGATCWALFPNLNEAEALARTVRRQSRDWWVETAWIRRPD